MNRLLERAQALPNPIQLSELQQKQFEQYYELLIEWNKVMNLTAITEKAEVIDKHFVDSIALQNVFPLDEITTVIDVGTGAGFPGIPLKIAFPHLKITLLDSLNKRVKFLNEVIHTLQLEDIVAIHSRAEDAAHNKEYRESYDLCVSRAVANLATLSEYCLPYVTKGGYFISYKSEQIAEELQQAKNAVGKLGGKMIGSERLQLPMTDITRSFVMIQKYANTAKQYPRKAGVAAKNPLT